MADTTHLRRYVAELERERSNLDTQLAGARSLLRLAEGADPPAAPEAEPQVDGEAEEEEAQEPDEDAGSEGESWPPPSLAMVISRKQFGRLLRRAREKRGLTQGELAEELGLAHQSAVSRIERGEAKTGPWSRLHAWIAPGGELARGATLGPEIMSATEEPAKCRKCDDEILPGEPVFRKNGKPVAHHRCFGGGEENDDGD